MCNFRSLQKWFQQHVCAAEKNKGKSKKRVLVLMSDTGGGHRASAEALKSAFQILYGNQYQVSDRLISSRACLLALCFVVQCISLKALQL